MRITRMLTTVAAYLCVCVCVNEGLSIWVLLLYCELACYDVSWKVKKDVRRGDWTVRVQPASRSDARSNCTEA